MTDPQPIDAPRPNLSTGPKTPEGKAKCRLNAYRHGLTGQLHIQSPDEQQAYDKHSQITLVGLAPVGDFECALAQSVANDLWRLNRAAAIESGMFALGTRQIPADTGAPQVAEALAQTHTWDRESHNLQLLTIYEQRIQRSVDKNLNRLDALRTRREQAAKEDMRQAKLLYQLAQAEGKPYQPEAYFTTVPLARESVFSTLEVAREVTREIHLADAIRHSFSSPSLTRAAVAQASASESSAPRAEESRQNVETPVKGPSL